MNAFIKYKLLNELFTIEMNFNTTYCKGFKKGRLLSNNFRFSFAKIFMVQSHKPLSQNPPSKIIGEV